jgi:hypothetical protein
VRACVDRDSVQRVAKGMRTATVEVREVPHREALYSAPRWNDF